MNRIQRPCFLNKIRDLGYVHWSDGRRVQKYRHPQTLHTIDVPRNAGPPKTHVVSALRQAGLSAEAIDAFLREATPVNE